MKNLLKAELLKLKKSTAYKVLLITYLLFETVIQMNNISNSVAYPKYNPTYTGMEFLLDLNHGVTPPYMIVITLFTAFFVNGDFIRHTFYTCFLCGISRRYAFVVKIISVTAGILPLALVPFVTGSVLWSIHAGFGMDFCAKTVWLIAKTFIIFILFSLVLVSNTVFFSVIAKSRIGAFGLGFGTLYAFGILRGNILCITHSEILRFILLLPYLNYGAILANKQRLGIAMALLGKPQLLFFDEPINGLDPMGIRDFHKLIRAMNKTGITILISSHLLRELDSLATCYGFIHKGKMLEQISANELAEKFSQYILLTVDNTVSTVSILKEKLGLTRLEAVSGDTVHVYEKTDKGGEMMKALITNGITVNEMTVKGEDLEKYYLSLLKNL